MNEFKAGVAHQMLKVQCSLEAHLSVKASPYTRSFADQLACRWTVNFVSILHISMRCDFSRHDKEAKPAVKVEAGDVEGQEKADDKAAGAGDGGSHEIEAFELSCESRFLST